jgi:acetyl esterase/lipase
LAVLAHLLLVGMLIKNAKKYGFAAKRIFLAGDSAGGHLASCGAPSWVARTRQPVASPPGEAK